MLGNKRRPRKHVHEPLPIRGGDTYSAWCTICGAVQSKKSMLWRWPAGYDQIEAECDRLEDEAADARKASATLRASLTLAMEGADDLPQQLRAWLEAATQDPLR